MMLVIAVVSAPVTSAQEGSVGQRQPLPARSTKPLKAASVLRYSAISLDSATPLLTGMEVALMHISACAWGAFIHLATCAAAARRSGGTSLKTIRLWPPLAAKT